MKKNMLKLVALGVALGGLCIAAPNKALAAPHAYRFHGAICNPNYNSIDAINYSAYGAYNAHGSGTPERVTCGINLPDGPTVTSVKVVVYDRHASDNVDCEVALLTNDDGSQSVTSSTLSSSGSSGDSQSLTYTPTATATKSIYVRCYLPHTVNGIESYLTAIVVNTSN
jgi:hypothetical protein